VGVAAGVWHSLGLKSDGTIVAWGSNTYGQCNVPAPNADFIGIEAGSFHGLGLKSDGSIVAWGKNDYGQSNAPVPNENFIAIAAGELHSLGLKSSPATAVEEPPSGHAPGTVMLAILSVAPNPFNPSIEVSLESRSSGPVTMKVYDVGGRLVRTLPLGVLGPGLHRARWDGRDGNGNIVSSGVYFVRLDNGVAESRAVKAVLIR
jgi:hypothetical protein